MGLADYILIGIVALWFAVALFLLIRARRRGSCGCGCLSGCNGCIGNCSICKQKCDRQNQTEK